MSVTVNQGLSDLSRELGEGTVNTTQSRVEFYADAVITLFMERKWKFALKKNTAKTTTTAREIDISDITDMRKPGGIKEILIADENEGKPILPIDFEDRFDSRYTNKKFFYIDEEAQQVVLMFDPTSGKAITIRYFHIPARVTDSGGTYTALPSYARKAVALLGASNVQYSRYLDSQGDKKYQLYTLELSRLGTLDRERTSKLPRNFGHFLKWRGFRRTYP